MSEQSEFTSTQTSSDANQLFDRDMEEALIGSVLITPDAYVDAAKRYISTSLRREYATENGTELNSVLPKMSPLNPQYLTKKQTVFQKIAAFVEKFKGVGGGLFDSQ